MLVGICFWTAFKMLLYLSFANISSHVLTIVKSYKIHIALRYANILRIIYDGDIESGG